MDEQIGLIPVPKKHPILAFALVHFPLSLLAFFLCMYSFSAYFELETLSFPIVTALLLVLYFPLGLLMGSLVPWARLDTPEFLVRAVFAQARIAWGWAALVLLSPWSFPPLFEVALPLTLLLAFPSSLFVLSAFSLVPWNGNSLFALMGTLAFLALPAGLLPPLLFDLGSFCVAKRKKAAV